MSCRKFLEMMHLHTSYHAKVSLATDLGELQSMCPDFDEAVETKRVIAVSNLKHISDITDTRVHDLREALYFDWKHSK